MIILLKNKVFYFIIILQGNWYNIKNIGLFFLT